MNKKYNYLIKNFLLFAIGNFLPKVFTFLMVPLYTACLSTSDYGVADLINTTISLLLPVFTINIQDAVLRFSLDDNFENSDVFSCSFWVILVGSSILIFTLVMVDFLSIQLDILNYKFYFILMFISQSIYNTFSMFCRGIDKVKIVVQTGILNTISSLFLNVIFLLCLDKGLSGYLLANVLGGIISIVYCFFRAKIYNYLKIKISYSVLNTMLKYSFPLIWNSVAWWINSASDKFFLIAFSGIAVSGIYAIANKIPSILSVLQNIFYQAWSISAIKEITNEDSRVFFKNTYNKYSLFLFFTCSLLMTFTKPLATLLYSNDFYSAWSFTPFLLIAVVSNSLALFIGSIFTALKKTRVISRTTLIGALVNTFSNFFLIYLIGALGAAIATIIGYLVTLIMRHFALKEYLPLKISYVREFFSFLILFLQAFTYVFISSEYYVSVAFMILILFLYINDVYSLFVNMKNRLTNY